MTDNLTCHAGDIVLLRAEIVGVGSDGPYVRVRTGSGRATCFWVPLHQSPRLSAALTHRMNPLGDLGWIPMRGHLTSRHDELGARKRGVGSHDRRKLLLVTGMDHLRVDVLLRCCRVYASS